MPGEFDADLGIGPDPPTATRPPLCRSRFRWHDAEHDGRHQVHHDEEGEGSSIFLAQEAASFQRRHTPIPVRNIVIDDHGPASNC